MDVIEPTTTSLSIQPAALLPHGHDRAKNSIITSHTACSITPHGCDKANHCITTIQPAILPPMDAIKPATTTSLKRKIRKIQDKMAAKKTKKRASKTKCKRIGFVPIIDRLIHVNRICCFCIPVGLYMFQFLVSACNTIMLLLSVGIVNPSINSST